MKFGDNAMVGEYFKSKANLSYVSDSKTIKPSDSPGLESLRNKNKNVVIERVTAFERKKVEEKISCKP